MAATPWPLVGRDREIAELRRALDAGRGAVVTGEAGVGKTRLVDEALRGRTDVVIVSTTEAAREIPLAAFAQLLGSRAGQGALHNRIGHALHAVEESVGNGLLFVDDVHNLDGASLTLLNSLVVTAGTRLVTTVRTPPDPPPEVVALWKGDHLERVDVAPLPREAVSALVGSVLGDGVTPALRDRLWGLSQGNVLFLRELVLAALEARDRGAGDEPLPLTALDEPGQRLRELVGARLARLEQPVREALELVAASEPLPLGVADRILDAPTLEGLEARGLIRVDPGGAPVLRTAHPLHGEVVRAELAPLRRRALLRRIVGAVDADAEIDLLRIATWRLDADEDDDPEFLAQGAWEAFHRFDNPLAERLGRRAWEGGSDEGGFALVEALMGLGRPDEVDEVLDALDRDVPEYTARVAVARSGNVFWQRGDPHRAVAVLEAAEARLDGRPDLASDCLAHRANLLFIMGRFDEAVRAADPVLADAAAPPSAALRAGVVAASAWAAGGRLDDVVVGIDEWLLLAAELPRAVPMADLLLRSMRFMALSWAGRAFDAEAQAADDLGLSVDEPPAGLEALLLGFRGRAAFARGRIVRAADLLSQAVEIGRHDDWLGLHPWALAFRARAETYLGNLEVAREALAEAEARCARMGSATVNSVLARGDIGLARAWITAAEGARGEASEQARAVAVEVEATTVPVALDALHAAVRLGRAKDVVDDVRRVAAAVQGPLSPLVVRHAEAAAAGDAEAIAEAGEAFAGLGLDLLAAETLTTAAEMLRAGGRPGAALTCDERAAELQRLGERVSSPAVALAEVPGAERLTDREQEVALLAAHGLTSPEVAERLYISVRTVHTHLQRAYRKLGVNSREGLAEAFEVDT